MDKQKVCCFTGHRAISAGDMSLLLARLDETVAKLIDKGVVYFGNGMATGFDTLAVQAVLRARDHNPAVKLIAVLPCANQDERWSAADQQTYRALLAAADKIVPVSDKPYFDGCMADRNRHLVRHSGVCVAYMKHGRSGTGQTVRMARENGLQIINLAE